MRIEIYRDNNLIKVTDRVLNTINWTHELMEVPSTTLELPIDLCDYFKNREEVKIFINDKCFWGITTGLTLDTENGIIEVKLDHIVAEWEYRQISVNNAIKDGKLNFIYESTTTERWAVIRKTEAISGIQYYKKSYNKYVAITIDDALSNKRIKNLYYRTKKSENDDILQDSISDILTDFNFACNGWDVYFSENAKEQYIEYVYSRQNKLEALNKTLELTDDLFWKVKFENKKQIYISEMGYKHNYMISERAKSSINSTIINTPKVDYDFSKVENVVTVYSNKSESGMTSMTLREIYNDKTLQDSKFPIVILRDSSYTNVNNERGYTTYTTLSPKIAPNNQLEYAIIDTEGVALEGGVIIEGTYAFDDLSPFTTTETNEEGEEVTKSITDTDRISAGKVAYIKAIKKLKNNRRTHTIEVECEELPYYITVGDMIFFPYAHNIINYNLCTNYEKKVFELNDWYYITKIDYNFEVDSYETNKLTLSKYLKVERDGY